MSLLPREVFAAEARRIIEEHSEWDAPHAFITFRQDDAKLVAGTYTCIMPDINPADYPQMMAGIARKELDEHPDWEPVAYLLQIEAYGVIEPGKDASAEERMRFQADRLGRTFHQRADVYEVACAYLADVHGRLWTAGKRRDHEGEISENFYPPGPRQPGGQMVKGLLAVAQATGMVVHGLPGPANLWN
jgi:hypothetical protein